MKVLAVAEDALGGLPAGAGFGRLPFSHGLGEVDAVVICGAGEETSAFELVTFLVQSGKRVAVVVDASAGDLRAQAFAAGAIDVVPGPLPADVLAPVLRTRLLPVEPRLLVPVQMGARFFGAAGVTQALLTDVSWQGFHARVETPLTRGTVIRVEAAGSEMPPLFARVLECAGGTLFAAFVSVLPEERERLAWFIGSLDSALDDGEKRLTRIAELRCEHLLVRNVIPGPPLPPLTDVEREALGKSRPDAEPLAWIALARMRANALAMALADPAVPRETSLEGASRREIVAAEESVRAAAAAALGAGQVERNRALTELHKRVTQAIEALERAAAPTDDTTRRQPLVTADGAAVAFRAPGESSSPSAPAAPAPAPAPVTAPASGTSKTLRLAFLGLSAGAVFGVASWRFMQLRPGAPGDFARQAVASAPVETIAGVRVEKIFETDDAVVAVVDGSWFAVGLDEKEKAIRELASKHGSTGMRFAVRDTIGREIAWIDSAGNGRYIPEPDKAYDGQ